MANFDPKLNWRKSRLKLFPPGILEESLKKIKHQKLETNKISEVRVGQ